jgi:hypothetical protein
LEVEEREKNVEPKLLHFYEKCCGMFWKRVGSNIFFEK